LSEFESHYDVDEVSFEDGILTVRATATSGGSKGGRLVSRYEWIPVGHGLKHLGSVGLPPLDAS
jgi:hypothetical protein